MSDIFALRDFYHDNERRNLVITDTRPSVSRCKCGNVLTIIDRNSTCKQCRMVRV